MEALGEPVGGDTQALAKMFSSVEAQTAILALAGAQSKDFASKTEAMYQAAGMTDKAFEAQTDTLEYTIQMIKNMGNNFMISVGRTILPYVREAAEKLLPAVAKGLELLKPILDGLFLKLSPIIEIAGTLLEAILPKITESFSKIQSVGSDVFGELQPIISNFAKRLLPILISGCMEFVRQVSDLAKKLLPIFKQVFGNIYELFLRIAPVVTEFAMNLLPALGEIMAGLLPITQVIADALKPIFDMIAQLAVHVLPALTLIINNVLVPLINLLAQLFANTLGRVLNDLVLPIMQNVINVLSALGDFISNVFAGNWEAAWENIKDILVNVLNGLAGLIKAPINATIALFNGVIDSINGLGITLPDWIPVIGGQAFVLDLPPIPYLASGGFTTGPSIAGEAGTEAVISFDAAYREENLEYWAKAGRMLGVDDTFLDTIEAGNSSSNSQICLNVTFAPTVNVPESSGNVKIDVMEVLKEQEEEFMDMLENMLYRLAGDSYRCSANYGV